MVLESEIARKVTGVTFAILLITAGFSGNVAAASTDETCTNIDALVFGFSLGTLNQKCIVENQVSNAVEDVKQSQDNQTYTTLYTAAVSQGEQSKQYLNSVQNNLNESQTIAWMRAEAAIAEAYENGSTETEAEIAAKEAIQKYYSKRQVDLIKNFNVTATAAYTLGQTAQNDTNNVLYDLRADGLGDKGDRTDAAQVYSATLANGSTHDSIVYRSTNKNLRTIHVETSSFYYNKDWYSVSAKPPSSTSYTKEEVIRFTEYKSTYASLQSKNDELTSQVDSFVNNTYTAYQNGQINATDVISRNNYAYQQGIEGAQNSTYANQLAAYSALGIQSPNLGDLGTMTISYNNNTYEGILYSTTMPANDTWIVGQTYDTANLGGIQTFITTNGNKMELNGSFTIEGITNSNGTQVNNVTTKRYNYVTTNTSDTVEKLDRLLELRKAQEAREPKLSSGGTGGDTNTNSFTLPKWLTATYYGIPLWGIIGIALGALYVFGSSRGKN